MNIDIDRLISLVEAEPILWDETLVIYRDRNKKRKVWIEIFKKMNNEFENFGDKEKNNYAKKVIKKWENIRDSFQKSEEQQKALKKSESQRVTSKKYIYGPQLQFLKKTFQGRSTDDSLSNDSQQLTDSRDIHMQEDILEGTHSTAENYKRQGDDVNFKTPNFRKRKADPTELELMSAIKGRPDRHLFFFRGIIPSLNTFNEDEILEFQMSVLQTIKSIKQRKNMLSSTQHVSVSRIPHDSQHATSLESHAYTNFIPQTLITQEAVNANVSNMSDMSKRQTTCFDFHSLKNPQTTVPVRRTDQFIQQELSDSPASYNTENSYDSFNFSA